MIKAVAKLFLRKLSEGIGIPTLPNREEILNNQIQQRQLQIQYQSLLAQKLPLPRLSDTGFRVYSEKDEDGILHYIFSLIGTTNKISLDIAFAAPYGGISTNLIINNGWNGILVCAQKSEVENVKRFFTSHPDTVPYCPQVYQYWVTAENVNEIALRGLKGLHIEGRQIDLFSLDIDGMDYWIWKALTAVEPRVVVVEYHHGLGERSITVPYKPDFNRHDIHPNYMGASLPALVKLAKEKGYRLVGCNRFGFNAFFIKNGIGEMLPEVSAQDCLRCPQALEAQNNLTPEVLGYEWTEV